MEQPKKFRACRSEVITTNFRIYGEIFKVQRTFKSMASVPTYE